MEWSASRIIAREDVGQTRDFARVGGGEHAHAGLVDRAHARGARADMGLAPGAGDALRHGGGDLEQSLLGGAALGRRGTGLRGQYADESIVDEERQRRVGDGVALALQEDGASALRSAPVHSLADHHSVLATKAAPGQRGGGQQQLSLVSLGVAQVDVGDAVAHSVGDALADVLQPIRQWRRPGQHARDLAHRLVARGLVAQGLVLLGAVDDLGIQSSELLEEVQIVGREGLSARGVMKIQGPRGPCPHEPAERRVRPRRPCALG